MQHRHPVRHRVIARHHNIIVVIQETGTLEDAEALALRMSSVPGTDVEIEEIIDPRETDLTTLSRELSEAVGWREPNRKAS